MKEYQPLLREAKGTLKGRLPSPVWRALRRTFSGPTRSVRLEDLDAELARVDQAFQRSEDEGLAALGSFELRVETSLPKDPWSAAYRDAQMELYRRISGRGAYSVDHERTSFDLAQAKREPYPYQTRSAKVVGDHLMAIGYLIRHLGLTPPAEIVELGPGWGNTTHALAQMGFRITAVDVDPRFLDLIRDRTAAFAERVTLVQADMLELRADRRFDAALFFESFHHCSDHMAMLGRLRDLVREDGRLIFASEPIDDFPMPWGVRLDGQSVWSTRRHGWLELGFETSYFFEALRRTGWVGRRYRSHAISSLTDVIVATRS